MVNTQGLKNYFKMSDLIKGQKIKLMDAGEIRNVEFEDKKTKEKKSILVLKFQAQIGNDPAWKELSLNKLSVRSLETALGSDTEKWKGQTCIVEMVKTVSFGELKEVQVLSLAEWDGDNN